ncbi:hypothetical protein Pmani_029054 [Petrolisthes manimaculis]|uniref:Uncharacterized protein n=1 Tax=Petrolisthes manimaculis TaxID=1843537 RepID=A0AAE1NYT6_9EUCA|nr:hypothetical protein Pmani_029054 [Petrolisthes manimaculis]
MCTIRKSGIGNVASASLQQNHYLHHGRRRPLAVRLHQLSEQLNVDLRDCDKFIISKIPPWEIPNLGINPSWYRSRDSRNTFNNSTNSKSNFNGMSYYNNRFSKNAHN